MVLLVSLVLLSAQDEPARPFPSDLLSPRDVRVFEETFDSLTLFDGRVLDRQSCSNTISCASTGLVSLAKIRHGVLSGGVDLPEIERVKNGFRVTVGLNQKENRGWLYHFTDLEGRPALGSEVSTIDTALFFSSFLKIAELLEDKDFEREVRDHLKNVDVEVVYYDGYFHHGFFVLKDGSVQLIPHRWENTDEGVILYDLFEKQFQPVLVTERFPLFVYYYPLIFDQSEHRVGLFRKAISFQRKTYSFVGITATDGPNGYQVGDPSVHSPLSLLAASRYCRKAREEIRNLSFPITTPAYSRDGWVAEDRLGIDYASSFLVVTNVSR